MSADNFVGVRPNADGTYSIFEYGCMSILEEDCMYLKDAKPTKLATSREDALLTAHDMVNEMDICEYGVVELGKVPEKFCGRCWVCVHQRGIVASDIPKCDSCNEPIAGEWMVQTSSGTYHNRCEPRRNVVNA